MNDKPLRYFDISSFQRDLLFWYSANKRELPWREDQDPYKVWVSEIMLQQTKVDTVIPYFNRFITKFPTVYDLAKADSQVVLKEWEGLGYYSRARNLQHAAREVVTTYGGQVPDDPKALGSLKGIGPYTRGAILSIAFDQPEPAVDGNVMRVLSRVLKIEKNIAQQRVRKLFEDYTRQIIPMDDPSSFNQGLMELGALICTPKAPLCHECPVQKHCKAYAEGIEDKLPIKTKAKKQKTLAYAALLIRDSEKNVVIEQRPATGLLANLWQFPMVPLDEVELENAGKWLYDEYGLSVTLKKKKGKLKHVFSHIIWEVEVYDAMLEKKDISDDRLRLISLDGLKDYPFPVSNLKMMEHLKENK